MIVEQVLVNLLGDLPCALRDDSCFIGRCLEDAATFHFRVSAKTTLLSPLADKILPFHVQSMEASLFNFLYIKGPAKLSS